MRGKDRDQLWSIRIVMCIVQIFRVRSKSDFWTSGDQVGEGGFVPPIVCELEKSLLRIDGHEHPTAIKVEEVDNKVILSLYPYTKTNGEPDGECAFQLVMDGKGAEALGTWLSGRGRDGGGRGSMLSMGRTND